MICLAENVNLKNNEGNVINIEIQGGENNGNVIKGDENKGGVIKGDENKGDVIKGDENKGDVIKGDEKIHTIINIPYLKKQLVPKDEAENDEENKNNNNNVRLLEESGSMEITEEKIIKYLMVNCRVKSEGGKIRGFTKNNKSIK